MASKASVERRRGELLDALDGPPDVPNSMLRAVFSTVVPDWRNGRLHFRWKDGTESGDGVVFGWPTVEGLDHAGSGAEETPPRPAV